MMNELQPDLVVSDVVMPMYGWFRALQKDQVYLKKHPIPVILLYCPF